jgi:hypothetical protein
MLYSNQEAVARRGAFRQYVKPARRRGDSIVQITAGDIHKALGFRNRVSVVCQTLRSKKFLEEKLVLEKVEGARSSQSTTVSFTYRLEDSGQHGDKTVGDDSFSKLRGIARDVFRNLGGGEAFIGKEREHFYHSGHDQRAGSIGTQCCLSIGLKTIHTSPAE